jgi:hypothetical protein
MTRDSRTGAAWLGAALALVALCACGVYPATLAARALSADGVLSDTMLALLRRSQQTLAFTLLVLAPLAFAASRLDRFVDRALRGGSARMATIALASIAFGATYLVQSILFGNIPHVTDATSHILQAKIFVEGRLWAPLPPCPEAFHQFNVFMTRAGRWFTIYPPGHALTLLIPLKLGLLHVAGPAAMACTVIALIALARRFFSEASARAIGLLTALSPLLLLLGGSYMSHTTALAYIASGFALLASGLSAPRRTGTLATSGFLLGMAAITRPQDAMLVAPAAALALAFSFKATGERWLPAILPFAAGLVPPLAMQLFWNARMFGSPLAFTYGHATEELVAPIIHVYYGLSADFPLPRAISQTIWQLLRFNQALLGWPAALPLMALALLAPDRRQAVCWVGFLWSVAFFFPYFYYGHEYEARFYAVAAPFAIALAVMGLRVCARKLGLGVTALAAAAFMLYAAAYYWPGYIAPRYGHDYEDASPALVQAAEAAETPALVLIDTRGDKGFRYTTAFYLNDPLLEQPVIFARDTGQSVECLRSAFPMRKFYRFDDASEQLIPSP